ncbi:MAG: CRISPR-associated protein Cas5 [Chloroflexi bacterium AL-W]|nr:CRISPR-associated protein Cas5 [Chloroflexi bacterium AL-N1]NOK68496.1 CRISPR-associated protein Cas5 [Chloroflexi bacterium AL-N10]NOK74142.1 CRISPR-associated protein Cas5 [Chloroflexi bacterium AL-N5]NOK83109.1 CRISPR-associated protein Cas5 [Chloroflexi bacterium AL-W]NOK90632.1 CRISPR-associated protein Cas5 [Chloroflexi bacterium AL-N15]
MQVLKVVVEGLTTSFRYPHFVQGVQPTFEMPPPTTIYGHICSALGEWVDPKEVTFAYHFTTQGRVDDVEHIHVVKRSSGKLPGTKIPKVLEGSINPFKRTLLFQPRLTLYLNRPEWLPSFQSPRYAVVLGRSQDLCSYTQIEVIELQSTSEAYFEHTLLPYSMATQMRAGVVALMPRYLDMSRNRTPTFDRYLMLQQRMWSHELLQFGNTVQHYLVDPQSPVYNGMQRALIFHHFVGDADGDKNKSMA